MFYAGRGYQGAQGPVYPYPLLDQLGETRQDKAYRALWLENEFVRLSILPEIGGRIFSAEDKTNGYPFFYRQHVVKPALIGMAGAWISGGVEWNVMHHHRATTFMPVQSAIVENADGSRTVWVGETEWRDRMRWVVGVTLRPGSSVVEADVRMLNRTPLPHSVLYFANPAVHANEDYEVLFPPDVAWATFHSKVDFAPWPLARGPFMGIPYAPGTNLGFWKNHPKPVSFFVYHSDLDFLGGYDHGRRAGVAHVADRQTVPGKKFWTWGNGPDGRMWDEILTDADGPYIELMTGGYSDNQPDYSWIQPGEDKALVQRWFPIRELGGMKAASADGALNLDVAAGRARVAVNTTSARPGTRVRLAAGDRVLFDESVSLGPAAPLAREVELPTGVGETDLRLSVRAADDREILSYTPRPRPKTPEPPRYTPPPAPAQVKSVEELVLAGRRIEQFRNPDLDPEPYYREALRRDPGDCGAHTALGSRALGRGQYDEALAHLEQAVARVTGNHTRARDGEPQYLLGLALAALGRTAEARDAFGAAAWDTGWRGAALLEGARLESREGRSSEALALAARAVAADPRATAAQCLHAALLRHACRFDDALAAATRALGVDPLDPLAARERRLAREAGARASAVVAMDALEAAALRSLDEDAYALEAAHDYAGGGAPRRRRGRARAPLPRREQRGRPARRLHARLRPRAPGRCREAQRRSTGAAATCRPTTASRSGSRACRCSSARWPPTRRPARALLPRQPALRPPARARDRGVGEGAGARPRLRARPPQPRLRLRARARRPRQGGREPGEGRRARRRTSRGSTTSSTSTSRWTRRPARDAAPPAHREPGDDRAARDHALAPRPRAAAARPDGRRARDARERPLPRLGGRARDPRGVRRGPPAARRAKLLARGDASGARSTSSRRRVAIPPNIEVGQAVGEHLAAVRHHVGLALEALGRKRRCAGRVPRVRRGPGAPAREPLLDRPLAREAGARGGGAPPLRAARRDDACRTVDPRQPLEQRMEAQEGAARRARAAGARPPRSGANRRGTRGARRRPAGRRGRRVSRRVTAPNGIEGHAREESAGAGILIRDHPSLPPSLPCGCLPPESRLKS